MIAHVMTSSACSPPQVLDGEAATPAAQSILLADAIRWTADVDDALADASNDNARGKPSEKSEAASVQRQTPSESVSERLSRLSEKLDAESESLRSAVKDSGESGAISGDRTTLDGWRLVAVEARKQVLGRLMAADDAFLEWKKELRYTWQEVSRTIGRQGSHVIGCLY